MKPTKQFVANFYAVCEAYQCTPEEIAEMKAAAKDSDGVKAEAVECFALLANEIEGLIPARLAA